MHSFADYFYSKVMSQSLTSSHLITLLVEVNWRSASISLHYACCRGVDGDGTSSNISGGECIYCSDSLAEKTMGPVFQALKVSFLVVEALFVAFLLD